MVRSEASSGNDAVHVHMEIQFLVPGVKDLDDRRDSAKIFAVSGEFQEGLSTAAVKEAVEKFLVAEEKAVEVMRECKDHMKVWCVDHFRASPVHPEFLFDSLAVWAVPVPAGVVVKDGIAAVITDADIASEGTGLTAHDRSGSFPLDEGLWSAEAAELPVGKLKGLPYISRHGKHRPFCQWDGQQQRNGFWRGGHRSSWNIGTYVQEGP